jgi:hypothetical protein
MDEGDAWIDSVLSASGLPTAESGGSAPEPTVAPTPVTPDTTQAVAPAAVESGTESSEPPLPVVEAAPVAPAPDPNEARFAALEAQLAEATQKATLLDQLAEKARAQHEQQARDQKAQAWQERALALENLPLDQQKIESVRLRQEVEAELAAQYQPQIQHREREVESTAALAAGFYHAITNAPIPEAVKQQMIADTKFLSTLPSPEAQTTILARDKRIAEAAVAAAKQQWDQANTAAIAAKATQRIEQGTDLVGTTPGGTGRVDDGSVDYLIDRVFGRA